jgi:hypothetical protein
LTETEVNGQEETGVQESTTDDITEGFEEQTRR